MRINNKLLFSLTLAAVAVALYRVLPTFDGVYGITPIFSIAIFGGMLFKSNKKWAFLLPILALFFSDVLWQLINGTGFYQGQLINYALFVLITCIGFFMRKINLTSIVGASVAAPTVFFILSNFFVWIGGGGLMRPKNLAGLLQTYVDGLPFYFPWQLVSTLFFSAILFGGMYLLNNSRQQALTGR